MAVPTWTTGQVLTASDVNTWFVPIAAVKTSTESVTSSTALQDDDALVLPLATNSTYLLFGLLSMDGAAAGDFKMDFTGPASATMTASISAHAFGGSVSTDDSILNMTAFADVSVIGTDGTGSTTTASILGTVVTAGTAGNLQLRWAQNASSGTATRLFARSCLVVWRIS
jgi:hypothetical protein